MPIRIGGFLQNSSIDYPGKIGPVIYLQGCNFKCDYCHNPDLVGPAKFDELLDNSDILERLKRMKGFADVVTITGGEPTLQKDCLLHFCEQIKKIGKIKIKVDTNGTNPDAIRALIDLGLVDYIAMDVKATPTKYHLLAKQYYQAVIDKVMATARLLIEQDKLPYEFRTTMVFPCIDIHNKPEIEAYADILAGAKQLYLQQAKINHRILYPKAFQEVDPRGDSFAWDRDSIEEFAQSVQSLNRGIKNISIR